MILVLLIFVTEETNLRFKMSFQSFCKSIEISVLLSLTWAHLCYLIIGYLINYAALGKVEHAFREQFLL
jgi:hypothetical protein